MSEYIVDLDSKHSIALRLAFVEEMRGGDFVREEIVRCRDCKHAHHYHPLDWRTGKPHDTLEEWYCDWHSNPEGASEIEPDGFCAWGERKEVDE